MFIYGTAWKEEETERLTWLALTEGFRALDTANQRKHYHEAGVGAAVKRALAEGLVRREDLFLQTKFTSLGGQDDRLPYDPDAGPATQVRQSFASSLEHLGVSELDSYVLHGPTYREGWSAEERAVWQTMEELHKEGKAKLLGVSNVSLEQLEELCETAEVPPFFVQNRCYARFGWDREVREFCADHGLIYQGFSLLTANRKELGRKELLAIAARVDRTPEQVVFRFALDVGMYPLTGTSSAEHMRQDLAVTDFKLSPSEVRTIEAIGL